MDIVQSTNFEEPKLKFAFGKNWKSYLSELNDERIDLARESLKAMLKTDLAGKSFIDVGCGSGLFSLAARLEGAKVVSFDVDEDSVQCCQTLKQKYFSADLDWKIQRGSALDKKFMSSQGAYDIVYSWGVLHHTGFMWDAIQNTMGLVGHGGLLYIAIYNDQGAASQRWLMVKKLYNNVNPLGKWLVLALCSVRLWGPTFVRDTLKGNPLKTYRQYKERGMSAWRDVIDWVGGYPFEVAKPEQIFNYLNERGFDLVSLETCGGGLGCNSFVFRKR